MSGSVMDVNGIRGRVWSAYYVLSEEVIDNIYLLLHC